MAVDVVSEIVIQRPRALVSSYAAEPDNAPRWYVNLQSVEWKSPRPLRVGSELAFVAHFLGRRLVFTYDVRECVPGELLVMRTSQGPFPMETTYRWSSVGEGSTRMVLRNRGEPSGFSRIATPLLSAAMLRANRKDLSRLRSVLEDSA